MYTRIGNLFCLIFLIIITALYCGGFMLAEYFKNSSALYGLTLLGGIIYITILPVAGNAIINSEPEKEKDEKKYSGNTLNILFTTMATIFYIRGLIFASDIQNINFAMFYIAFFGGIIYSIILCMCFCSHANIGLCLILWFTQKRREKEEILKNIIYGG